MCKYNSTCCARLTLAIAFALGSSFYIIERQHDVWFLDQAFPFHGQETFVTEAGDKVRLPIMYADGSLVGAFYLVDPDVAQALLPKSMEPLMPRNNYHLVTVCKLSKVFSLWSD